MRNLIDFLVKNLYWLVFLVLETISLVAFFRFNRYQGTVFLTTANSVVGSVNRFTSGVAAYLGLATENAQLEAENELLRGQLLRAQERLRAHEAQADSSQLADSVVRPYRFVPAQVVKSTLHRSSNLLTIDRGEADGVRPEMGVVSSRGVVGIVYLASAHYAVVVPLLSTSSRVSCRLRGSGYFGTMRWQRGNPDVSYAEAIPRHARIHRGDTVETNGYSDIFPEGIPIGRVARIADSPDGMTYRLTVQLATDFKTLRNVSVITDYSIPERRLLEERADSLSAEPGGRGIF